MQNLFILKMSFALCLVIIVLAFASSILAGASTNPPPPSKSKGPFVSQSPQPVDVEFALIASILCMQ